jgi:hypothetical protein
LHAPFVEGDPLKNVYSEASFTARNSAFLASTNISPLVSAEYTVARPICTKAKKKSPKTKTEIPDTTATKAPSGPWNCESRKRAAMTAMAMIDQAARESRSNNTFAAANERSSVGRIMAVAAAAVSTFTRSSSLFLTKQARQKFSSPHQSTSNFFPQSVQTRAILIPPVCLILRLQRSD